MYTAEFNGINSFLVGTSKLLLEHRVLRMTRGEKCWELPEPLLIKIKNPLSRIITIRERKWNLSLPYAESLWLASGRNDLSMIGQYLGNMSRFSDDGSYLRGGYGPRLRYYNQSNLDYEIDYKQCVSIENSANYADQFRYVYECFQRDPFTRQATIVIGDPSKDCFTADNVIKETKDLPCTRHLQFSKNATENKLDLTVYMRSNDLIWGASGVNLFNYMFMQEYFANILGLQVGNYYHFANNMHYYDLRHSAMIEELASITDVVDEAYSYKKSFQNLKEFDFLLNRLKNWEENLRSQKVDHLEVFNDDFFDDWGKVLFNKLTNANVSYINPILNNIANVNARSS